MKGKQIAFDVLQKYSSAERDETHCRMSDLVADFADIIDRLQREVDQKEDHHQAWLRIQRNAFSKGESPLKVLLIKLKQTKGSE